MEKLLNCWIVQGDEELPRSHDLFELASLAKLVLANVLLDLQPFAVEARHWDGGFPLTAECSTIQEDIQQLMETFQAEVDGNEEIKE